MISINTFVFLIAMIDFNSTYWDPSVGPGMTTTPVQIKVNPLRLEVVEQGNVYGFDWCDELFDCITYENGLFVSHERGSKKDSRMKIETEKRLLGLFRGAPMLARIVHTTDGRESILFYYTKYHGVIGFGYSNDDGANVRNTFVIDGDCGIFSSVECKVATITSYNKRVSFDYWQMWRTHLQPK